MPGSSDETRSDPTPAAATSTGLVRRRPGLVWLLAALLVPVLLTAALLAVDGVGAAQANGGTDDTAQTAPSPTAPTATATATPGTPAEATVAPFSLTRTADSFTVQAVVADQATKDAIAAEVRAQLAEGTEFVDQITVDPAVALPDPAAVSALLRALSAATEDVSVKYDGSTVTLSGKVSDQATKAAAARAAAKAVPGAVVANELQVPAIEKPAVSEACQTFDARLAQLMSQNKIVFLSGTAIVNEPSRPSVTRAAALLKSCDTALVEVAGHTDNLGDPATSLPLSQQRADAVKATLVKLGVSADRITSRGYGESQPVASNSTSAGRIANRRVEIRVP